MTLLNVGVDFLREPSKEIQRNSLEEVALRHAVLTAAISNPNAATFDTVVPGWRMKCVRGRSSDGDQVVVTSITRDV